MTNQIGLYIGAALTLLWGIAHLLPTKSVVQGFGEISVDNRRIISMEWLIQGVAMVSLFTGFKVRLLPFKLCPVIFSVSATLILAGSIFL
jgi:hypothetical protein